MALPVQASLAAQVAAQARPIVPIRPTTLPPSKAPITVPDAVQRFTSLVQQSRRTAGELAYLGFRIWAADDWQSLGFVDEDGFCDALGVSHSWWRQCVRLGERLQSLTLAEMQNMTQSTMESLARVHPSIWSEYAWVEESKALRGREFSMLVTERNEKVMRGHLSEPRVQLMLRVPLSQHPVLERRLESIRRQERLSSAAEALNFALESVDEKYLLVDTLADIQRQVGELSRVYGSIMESPDEKESRLETGTDLSLKAKMRAQQLTSRILKTIGAVCDESGSEEVPSPNAGTISKTA